MRAVGSECQPENMDSERTFPGVCRRRSFILLFTEKYNFSLVLDEHMCYINIERMFGTRTDKEYVFYGYVSDVGEKR